MTVSQYLLSPPWGSPTLEPWGLASHYPLEDDQLTGALPALRVSLGPQNGKTKLFPLLLFGWDSVSSLVGSPLLQDGLNSPWPPLHTCTHACSNIHHLGQMWLVVRFSPMCPFPYINNILGQSGENTLRKGERPSLTPLPRLT